MSDYWVKEEEKEDYIKWKMVDYPNVILEIKKRPESEKSPLIITIQVDYEEAVLPYQYKPKNKTDAIDIANKVMNNIENDKDAKKEVRKYPSY
ncbi:MAG: hypothetical protein ACOCP8_02130 [archaeon]